MTNKVLGGGALDGNLGLNPTFADFDIPLGRVVQSIDDNGTVFYWLVETTSKSGWLLANGLYANPTKVVGDSLPVIAGSFVDGFTFTAPNQVGIDSSGDEWKYIGDDSLPVVVAPNTDPSASGGFKKLGKPSADDYLNLKIFQSPTDGLTEIQTRTLLGGEVYEVRKVSNDSLATIYSDAAGTAEIEQNGDDNVSGSDGVVEFYIADGDYYVEVGAIRSDFNVDTNKRPREVEIEDAITEDAEVGTEYFATDLYKANYIVVDSSDSGGYYYAIMPSGRKLRYIYGNAVKAYEMIKFSNSSDNAVLLQTAYDYFVQEFYANKVIEFHLPDSVFKLSQLKVTNDFEYDKTQKWQTFVGGNILHDSETEFLFTKSGAENANCLKFKGTHFFDIDGGYHLFDADTIRRVSFEGCCFTGVNTAIYSGSYAQTFYFDSGCLVRQGNGWFIDINSGFDIKFLGEIVEHRDSFWRTRSTTANPACNSFVLRDSLIEGLTGKAIEWGACYACVIDGTYQEQNAGGYIDCSISSSFHKGLAITNNSIQLSAAQITASLRPIKWGKSAVELKSGGNASTGNLHDLTGTTVYVDMTGDYAAGELYNGYKPESDPSRSPSGWAKYSRGATDYIAFNDRYIATDPFVRGRRIGGVGYEDAVSGELAPIYEIYGTADPYLSPGSYSNRKWAAGSKVFKPRPVKEGVAPNRYIILGWVCVQSGSGGSAGTDIWEDMRVLTGD